MTMICCALYCNGSLVHAWMTAFPPMHGDSVEHGDNVYIVAHRRWSRREVLDLHAVKQDAPAKLEETPP